MSQSEFEEMTKSFSLTSGESLWEASQDQTIALVFLRHFGCTFTRQIIRGLEEVDHTAKQQGARLVLVHMLKSGEEVRYLSDHEKMPRITDPHCHLYRAFGLGKGGFFELFGPRVLFMGVMALFKGCGVGYLAGDGRQMPGAFLFRKGHVIASQPAKDASELPNLPALFAEVT